MISLEKFKAFAQLPTEAIPAQPARGLLVISKASGHEGAAFDFPAGSLFQSGGKGYVSSEDFQLSESSEMIELALTARQTGPQGNLPAGANWISPVANTEGNNPAPFTGGAEAIPAKNRGYIDWDRPDDDLIQDQLNVAQKNILTKLGNPAELPNDPRVSRAVYLLGTFYLENRQTQETVIEADASSLKKSKTSYYREKVFQALMFEINNLLNPFIDIEKFMPSPPA